MHLCVYLEVPYVIGYLRYLRDYMQEDLNNFCFMCFPCVYVLKGSLCYWILKKDLRDYTKDDLSIFCFMRFACVYVFT
jgi:hypothetical protein